ncbi:MAG: hypothetical protein IT462_11990 [Planctomycetes bacterium]|nr:hypothetical protein [Planctomycetota bacterium]
MKFHAHVGVVETRDEQTLNEVLVIAKMEGKLLARLAPNLAVLEVDDAREVLETLEKLGKHPKVMR